MSFITDITSGTGKLCFKACDPQIVFNGQCECHNRIKGGGITLSDEIIESLRENLKEEE